MTAIDNRAEALADHLHYASVAAAQLADARDQARTEAPGSEYLAADQITPVGRNASDHAALRDPAGAAGSAGTGEK